MVRFPPMCRRVFGHYHLCVPISPPLRCRKPVPDQLRGELHCVVCQFLAAAGPKVALDFGNSVDHAIGVGGCKKFWLAPAVFLPVTKFGHLPFVERPKAAVKSLGAPADRPQLGDGIFKMNDPQNVIGSHGRNSVQVNKAAQSYESRGTKQEVGGRPFKNGSATKKLEPQHSTPLA